MSVVTLQGINTSEIQRQLQRPSHMGPSTFDKVLTGMQGFAGFAAPIAGAAFAGSGSMPGHMVTAGLVSAAGGTPGMAPSYMTGPYSPGLKSLSFDGAPAPLSSVSGVGGMSSAGMGGYGLTGAVGGDANMSQMSELIASQRASATELMQVQTMAQQANIEITATTNLMNAMFKSRQSITQNIRS